MNYVITQKDYNLDIEKKIKQGMNIAAKAASGIDGWYGETVCFVAAKDDIFVGAVVIDIIYGQLRIESLYVEEKYRRMNIGSQLLIKALELGISKGCTFAYLETLNFQGPDFYEKHGFVLEFSRSGYTNGIIFNYYRKELV